MLDDPLGIDRRLREVTRSQRSFRAALREGRGEDHAFELTGRFASLELLTELSDNAGDPLAPALLRSAHRLHEAHALLELDRSHAVAFRVERHPIDEPERGHFTPSELFAFALADRRGQRAAFLATLARTSRRATELALRRAEQHAELRASLTKLVPPDLDLPGEAVLEAATSGTLRTNDALGTLAPASLAELLELGLGRDSRASWPARLTARSVAELFDETPWLAHVTPEPFALPPALGAASYELALFRFGAALRAALAASTQPFVVAHDPYGLERATFGALFALLPAKESFARRCLGVASAGADDHRRTVARVLLVTLREALLRVSLRAPALAGSGALSRAYPELTLEALGIELEPTLLGVLFTPRAGDAQRFAALLLAANLDHELTEGHDEDWYRNPRAVEDLRERCRGPAETLAEAAPLEAGAERLATFLTGAL